MITELDGLNLERLITFNQFTKVQEITDTGFNRLHHFDPTSVEIIKHRGYPMGLRIHIVPGSSIEIEFNKVFSFGYDKGYFTLNIADRERSARVVRKLRFA